MNLLNYWFLINVIRVLLVYYYTLKELLFQLSRVNAHSKVKNERKKKSSKAVYTNK